MDINGFSLDALNMEDSNPGTVEYCPGGVGRNIAENLHRLGVDVRFIGVIGDDPGGELLKTSSARMGLNIAHSLFLKDSSRVTSVYIALMDSNGEMKLALSDMGIVERLTAEHLDGKAAVIEESAIVVLDTNLPPGIIGYALDRFGRRSSGGPLFFLDAVSAKKAARAAPRIGHFDTLKLGSMEAAALAGTALSGEGPELQTRLKEAVRFFTGRGVRRVFITLGKKGVFTGVEGGGFFTPVRYARPVNTSGGGDAFMAGIVYGTLRGWEDEKTVSFSSAMARLTVQSKSTVSPEMGVENVMKDMDIFSQQERS